MDLIGIDIGGTKIAYGLVRDGSILYHNTISTEADLSFHLKMNELVSVINKIPIPAEIKGIGIGCAGPLDMVTGEIQNPYTLPAWQGKNIIEFMDKHFHIPIVLENDVDTAIIGLLNHEYPEVNNAVMLTFGTGIGGAVVIDGQIFRLGQKRHPELGHIPILNEGPECYCGIKGCFESLASGKSFHSCVHKKGFKGLDDFYDQLEAGNSEALDLVYLFSDYINKGLSTLKIIFEPDYFILGGGFMERFFPWYVKHHDPQVLISQFYKTKIKLVRPKLNCQTAILGAAVLAENKINTNEAEK